MEFGPATQSWKNCRLRNNCTLDYESRGTQETNEYLAQCLNLKASSSATANTNFIPGLKLGANISAEAKQQLDARLLTKVIVETGLCEICGSRMVGGKKVDEMKLGELINSMRQAEQKARENFPTEPEECACSIL